MKSTPANLCVIAHFIGRGACVYCRLLSVLLMQIIKFGGKLVVNPRCSSIEHHNFKRNKAIFTFYCSIGFIVGMSSTSSYKPLFLDTTLHRKG